MVGLISGDLCVLRFMGAMRAKMPAWSHYGPEVPVGVAVPASPRQGRLALPSVPEKARQGRRALPLGQPPSKCREVGRIVLDEPSPSSRLRRWGERLPADRQAQTGRHRQVPASRAVGWSRESRVGSAGTPRPTIGSRDGATGTSRPTIGPAAVEVQGGRANRPR
jgi:hypothetical protein